MTCFLLLAVALLLCTLWSGGVPWASAAVNKYKLLSWLREVAQLLQDWLAIYLVEDNCETSTSTSVAPAALAAPAAPAAPAATLATAGSNVSFLYVFLAAVRLVLRLLALLMLAFALPLYVLLSQYFQTFSQKYSWVASPAYLSGQQAGLALMAVFCTCILAAYYLMHALVTGPQRSWSKTRTKIAPATTPPEAPPETPTPAAPPVAAQQLAAETPPAARQDPPPPSEAPKRHVVKQNQLKEKPNLLTSSSAPGHHALNPLHCREDSPQMLEEGLKGKPQAEAEAKAGTGSQSNTTEQLENATTSCI